MAHSNTLFHSLTEFISRHDLDEAERKSRTQNRCKTSRWSQFIALLMAQVLKLGSLRDIENASKSMKKKFYHLGAKPIPKSTLARMNETLDAAVFKRLFEKLHDKCAAIAPKSKFRLKGCGKLFLMDATVISLNLRIFPWATFRQRKGAIKLHVGLSDDGLLPAFCDLTKGSIHEINHARKKSYPKGSLICFDRGYSDYKWWEELTKSEVFFVTRLKSNADYTQIRRRAGRRSKNVMDDESIQLKGGTQRYRLVRYYDCDTENVYEFITNADHLNAQTIADIYKERWKVELFFKWIKQNLKIKNFLGTSVNAVLTQIWIALILYLLVSYQKFISKTKHSIREILNWICINLFQRVNLSDYLAPQDTEFIAARGFALF